MMRFLLYPTLRTPVIPFDNFVTGMRAREFTVKEIEVFET
jgi:hypothetical protein